MIRSNRYLFIVFTAVLFSGCTLLETEDPVPVLKIGVMLPYSGEYASEWDNALDWAAENVNLAGGVAGCNIELVKKDIADADITGVAQSMVANDEIKAVIGPLTSSGVFKVAPEFINGKKVLISPVATAANISRAFAGRKYFWRLAEPDISQTKTLLLLAKSGGARKVGLITEESQYGASFEDWFGYFATELGLEVTGIRVIEPDDVDACNSAWQVVTGEHPDAVIAAVNSPAQNAELVKSYRSNGQQIRLLFSDAACLPALVDNLGTLAENLEGITLTSDPTSGFDISYKVKYGKYPNAFLANMYDAVMLIALALETSNGEGGEALADALVSVVTGDAGSSGWQRDEIRQSIKLLQAGTFPNIKGASGSLNYDELYFTDVTSSTYGHWRVDAGEFVVTEFYTSDGNGRISSTSAAYRTIATQRQQFDNSTSWPTLSKKEGNYAFLMATSKGWENYRHQADVLHAYQLLKKNGFGDEQIILILEDDIAGSPSNPLPGIVRNEAGGENIYENVEVDYKLTEINSENIKNILSGISTAQTPVVLTSGKTDNIFMFTSGHGSPEGMVLESEEIEILTPQFWETVFEAMNEKDNYRQIFWGVEACYSGSIGEKITAPGVMLMTGANPFETSKAHHYDSEIQNWLADKFAYSINNTISESPGITFEALYEKSFTYVNGSHVSFYNYERFGNIYEISLSEFVTK